jgi:hypothetical protein
LYVVVFVVVLALVEGGLVVAAFWVVELFEEEPHPTINEHKIARLGASSTIGFLVSLRMFSPPGCAYST